MLGIVENGLYEGLKGRVARLEIVNVLLVDSFATVIRVGVVDTFGTIDRGTSGATGGITITLMLLSAINENSDSYKEYWRDTLDFRLRQAMQAVLTQRRLADADSLS